LSDDEFEFVSGHEIGHFLLEHDLLGDDPGSSVHVEYFLHRRCQEVSVDRIGLIACGSLETSIRALMKAVSGLTERHLRFDIGAFLAQLRKIGAEAPDWSMSTHPSALIRAKALLWFSLSDYLMKGAEFYSKEQFRQIDERIERDLRRFVDGTVKGQIDEAIADLMLWSATYEVIHTGSFSRKAQFEMELLFGRDAVARLRSFLGDLDQREVANVVHERVIEARERLEALVPSRFMREVTRIAAEVAALKQKIEGSGEAGFED